MKKEKFEVWLPNIAEMPFKPGDEKGWSRAGEFESEMEAQAFLDALHEFGVIIDPFHDNKEKIVLDRAEAIRRGVDAYLMKKKRHVEVKG